MPEVEQSNIIKDTSFVDFVVKALRACLKIQPDLTIEIGLHIWFEKQ